jgi:glycosyltransferase involved in cell wall biosynthesis
MTLPDSEHTFVILAYKESKYLEACIQSVLQQSIPSRVLIATSTPNAYISSLAEKYQLEIFTNYNSGSIGKDWNFGYNCVTTKYVTIAHQDDIYVKQFAEKCLHEANKYSKTKPLIVFTKSLVYKDDAEINISFKNVLRWLFIFPFHFKKCIRSKALKRFILLFSNSISCPGVFYCKQNLDCFSFNENDKYILDWRAWFEMSCMDGAFIYLKDELHIHREHEDSATSTTQTETLQREEFELLSEIWRNRVVAKLITALLKLAK